jgi:uncharacterized protein (DUF1810 family)
MNEPDPFNLHRFLTAQAEDYECALGELQRGRKESHWIWYIFPQVAGLGHSSMAQQYAIRSRDEAVAYLGHAVLGARLQRCCEALLKYDGKRVEDIMGFPDDLKLGSSMTLFAMISGQDSVFHKVLNAFYSGQMDESTVAFLDARPWGAHSEIGDPQYALVFPLQNPMAEPLRKTHLCMNRRVTRDNGLLSPALSSSGGEGED